MTDRPTVLVPLEVLEGESIPDGVPALLADAHVVLLGYHVIPEQTATEQAREQFGPQAMDRLEEFEEMVSAGGATIDSRLVFTHEGQQTIDRVIYEEGCQVVLVPKATPPVEDVLVPVRGRIGNDRLETVVGGLFADSEATITLFHVTETGETDAAIEELLEELAGRLVDTGIDGSRIVTRVESGAEPLERIIDASGEADVVVMGESDPSVATFVFGLPETQLADQFLGPVFIVQRPRPDSQAEETAE